MQDVKILRLVTGEDVIAKVGENDQGVSLNKPFVIIPTQSQMDRAKPIQLMMTLYSFMVKSDSVTIKSDKIISMVEPKEEILKSYQQNIKVTLNSI